MKKGLFLPIALVAVVLLAFGFAAPDVEAAEGPLKIRMAHGIPPAHLTPLLFQKKELLKHYGKSYVVELHYVRASSAQIPMLAAKELDIAWLAYASFANAIVNAKLDLRIVADLLQYGAPGYFSGYWSVMKKSDVREVKDLKGKRIAVPAFGTALDMALRVMLRKVGLEAGRDYTPVEVRFPNMYAMLSEGKVDSAIVIPPWWYMEKIQKNLRPIFSPDQALGRVQALMQVARADFLKKNQAALKDFFEDYLRAWKWFLNPANREEALDITARFAKRPRKNYATWALTKKDYFRDPDGRVNAVALQNNVNVMHKLGYLKRPLETGKYIDMSYIEEAKRRLSSR